MPPDGKSAPVLDFKMRQNRPCAKLKQQKKRLKTAWLSRFSLAGAEGLGLACRLGRCFCILCMQRSPQETRTPRHSPSASFSFFAHTKNSKHRKSGACCFGRGRRDRTLGTRFWRPMLYQLSYTPIIKKCLLWWTITDSNRGPTGYEPVALTN